MKGISKIICLTLVGCLIGTSANAQSPATPSKSDGGKSFQEFRNSMYSDFRDFRQRLIDQYEDFLNGEWHEYESLSGEVRDKTPKPKTLPKAPQKQPLNPSNKTSRPQKKPPVTPVSPQKEKPAPPAKENAPTPEKEKPAPPAKENVPIPEKEKPVPPAKENVPTPEKEKPAPPAKENAPTPEKEKPAPPVKENAPTPPVEDVKEMDDIEVFSFYNIPIEIKREEFNINQRLENTTNFGTNWKQLKDSKIATRLLPHFQKLSKEMNLNDYLQFRLIESYVNNKFPKADPSSRYSLIHFLLVNMGYNVRLGIMDSNNPVLLIPLNELVYGRAYMNVDGTRYYVFQPGDADNNYISRQRIRTCQLPTGENLGKNFEVKLSNLNLPFKPKSFNIEYGPISLKGEVNENLMPVLYRYPQMSIEYVATSVISPELRKNVVEQVRTQLSNFEGDEKVAALLSFMHNAFEYSVDQDYHGFEKPYYFEETLYYPLNDCEDRAIFYTWLLWNALGREAQLVTFPGHEAATVVMDQPLDGTSYTYEGKTFYISDPTYIGARTGMVMPNFKGLAPEIDYTYSRNYK